MPSTATKSKPKADAQNVAPGFIEPTVLYRADEAQRRLRLGAWAWRQMRRDGLAVLRVNGRAFVMGSALIEFIERKGREGATDYVSEVQAER
jgi:hypothetical protein